MGWWLQSEIEAQRLPPRNKGIVNDVAREDVARKSVGVVGGG